MQLLALAGMVAYLAGRPASELRNLAEAYVKNSDIFAAREAKKRKAGAITGAGAAAATAADKPDKVLFGTCCLGAYLSRPLISFHSLLSAHCRRRHAATPQVHTTTVLMMACMIQALPYDLPAFVPSLLTSFVRHVTVPSLKDVGTSAFAHKHAVLFSFSSSSHVSPALLLLWCGVVWCGVVAVTKTVQMFKRTHQDRWEADYKHRFSREQLEDLQGAGAAHYFS